MAISGIISSVAFIKKNKIDFCLAMWAVPSGLFALFAKILLKIPYSVWVLGSDIWEFQNYPLGKLVLKKVFKNAKNLFADGMQLVRDVENISSGKCKFLVSGRILELTTRDIEYSKFDPSKINFICIARYHENKGVDMLIDAISLLSEEEKKKSLFHIFGGGPLENKIKEQVKKLGLQDNTFVNNYLDAEYVYSYLIKSDFAIIPSRIESIPSILSDSMQAKKPVLVTNVGDMGTLVRKFKVGFVTEPNPEGLKEGIDFAIKSNKENLQTFYQGIEALKNYLDIKSSVKVFSKLLESSM